MSRRRGNRCRMLVMVGFSARIQQRLTMMPSQDSETVSRPCFFPCFLPDLYVWRSTDKLDLLDWRPAVMRTAMICMQFGNVQLRLLSDSLSLILTLSSTIHTQSVSCTRPLKSFACAPSDRHSSVFAGSTGLNSLEGS